MSCLMADVVHGRVTPQVANAAVNAGGKLLKVVEMQLHLRPIMKRHRRDFPLIIESEDADL